MLQDDNLEVDGVSIHDSHDNTSSAGTSSVTGLSLSSMSNITSYNTMLSYTKRRLDKTGRMLQAKSLTHTAQRPAIVIPCHTNIECMYCKLYNEDHALHSQCATPDIPAEEHPPEPPKPVPQILLSMEENISLSKQRSSPTKSAKTTSAKSTVSQRSTKSRERTTPNNNNSTTPDLELSAHAILARSSIHDSDHTTPTALSEEKGEYTETTDKGTIAKTKIDLPVIAPPKSSTVITESKVGAASKSPVVAPKIYKLKYTKSSNPGIGKLDLGLASPFVH